MKHTRRLVTLTDPSQSAGAFMLQKTLLCLAGLTCFSMALALGTPATAQGLFASLSPRVLYSGLPAPPAHFTHRVVPTTKPELERPPLQFNVRPRQKGGTGHGRKLEGSGKTKELVRRAPPVNRRVNPLPLILTDGTLRAGDIVVFPDGPRVFTGLPGLSHSAVDFEKIRRGAIRISKRTRDALAKIKTGVNDAWAAVRLGNDGKLKEHVAMNPYTKNPAFPPASGPPANRRAQAVASSRPSH
jgi:hypothetical protein